MKSNNQTSSTCHLANGFSLGEKIYAQVTFFTMGIAGTVAIALADWRWIFPYLVIYWYGIPGVVMRHLVCPRCPHLHVYGDCLQLHPKLTRLLIVGRKSSPFTRTERFLFLAILILIPIYPLPWIRHFPYLLIPFLAAAILWYSGQLLYFCRRCRLKECPLKR